MNSFLSHYTLLIVEDDIACNKQLMGILQSRCLEIYSAKTVTEGLKLFEEKDPDIIISSSYFNELNGAQMDDMLQKIGAQKPIIVINTLDQHEALIKAITLGVKNYLFKPINHLEVINILERIAEQLHIKDEHSKTNALLGQYKKAVDLSCIVTKTNSNGIITYANEQFIEISGYTQKELIGKSHKIVRHPDMPSSIFRDLWQTLQAKKVWQGVIKNRAKNGSAYIVSATIMPILQNEKVI